MSYVNICMVLSMCLCVCLCPCACVFMCVAGLVPTSINVCVVFFSVCISMFVCVYARKHFKTEKNKNFMDLFLFNFILNSSFFICFVLVIVIPKCSNCDPFSDDLLTTK
jgi:hypothetical protein